MQFGQINFAIWTNTFCILAISHCVLTLATADPWQYQMTFHVTTLTGSVQPDTNTDKNTDTNTDKNADTKIDRDTDTKDIFWHKFTTLTCYAEPNKYK